MSGTFISIRKYSEHLRNLLIKMPKDQTHLVEKQKAFVKIRERSKLYSPGTVNIQILGSGSKGSPASVYLFSEQARYLFNCGEGTQRLAHEHKTKLTKLEHIFLTRKTWDCFGGVSGLCLTLQEVGVPQLELHGPSGINEIFQASRRFVVLRNLRVAFPECKENFDYDDNVMSVKYVHLYKDNMIPKEQELTETGQQSYLTENDSQNDVNYETQHENYVMSYICKLKSRAGALDLESCVERGVPPGPLLGRLKNGFDVTLDNGNIVKADDVRKPSCPGAVFAFVDIPDISYLSALKACDKFKMYQKTATVDHDMAVAVVHFSPEEIINTKEYQEFMECFAPSTKHLIVNNQNEFSGYLASHRIQWELNELDQNIFPKLKERHPQVLEDNLNIENSTAISDHPEMRTMTSFHLRPAKGLDRTTEPFCSPEEVLKETFLTEGLKEAIEEYKKSAKNLIGRSKEMRDKEYPKVVYFGTGSCIPNKTRNVSAILVHTDENSCFLLDCGEGTYGQIVRFYGKEGTDNIMKKLKMIYVSHLHADHHLGLIDLLQRRRILIDEKVVLIAPVQINNWLNFYNNRITEIESTYELVPNGDLLSCFNDDKTLDSIKRKLGLVEIETCYVKHCPNAFGLSFQIPNKMICDSFPLEVIKITYSGDCLPSKELARLGEYSDLLIHEATMEDALSDEAKIKMHSTISEAIAVGREMKAKYTMLTHFSQRYAKIPLMDSESCSNVGIAFDNMEVTLNDLPVLHLMYEPLKLMFNDHFQQMEQKAVKRKFQLDRKVEKSLPIENQKKKISRLSDDVKRTI